MKTPTLSKSVKPLTGSSQNQKEKHFCGVSQKFERKFRPALKAMYAKSRKDLSRTRLATAQEKLQSKPKVKSQKQVWNYPKPTQQFSTILANRRTQFEKEEQQLSVALKNNPAKLKAELKKRKRELLLGNNDWLKHLQR